MQAEHASRRPLLQGGVVLPSVWGYEELMGARPRVSNENPFSESPFKTLKYCLRVPAELWVRRRRPLIPVRRSSATPTTSTRHSGIGLHTPASLHHGSAHGIRVLRRQALDNA